ncbi:hypothetical protein Ddye_018773 [Dipteronia dyeriana]|uniref:Uncharacterized protein n=1 Tax=Dipteronia dyeriana TaxID=168575 RepID=A0AAD9X152_9ROSI|nr:hypothetical protein Ddye_018773 [Dipteronia dyeriana]
MRRGRGKGKKPTVISSHEDAGTAEEEKLPAAYRRRGRPQKPLNDDVGEEEEAEAKNIEEEGDDKKGSISTKDIKIQAATANGKKRKRSTQAKEDKDFNKHENGIALKPSSDDSTKSVGFRQNGSRRKNKPRRAAEAGVECK